MVAMSRSGQGKQHRRHLVGTLPATITSAVMIVTVLAVAGCGLTSTTQVSGSGSHATASPSNSTLPLASLSWTTGNLSPGYSMMGERYQFALGPLDIAAYDGNTAYSCTGPTSASAGPSVWVTHNRAQHWTPLAALPPVAQHLTFCTIIPDAVNPAIAVATVSWSDPAALGAPPQDDVIDFVTFDGGAHWQLLDGPVPFVLDWLATIHGTTLAMLISGAGDGTENLWSSTDQMQTWHELTQAPVGQLWMNPTTGELLEMGQTNSGLVEIYQSSDLGQNWTSFPTPIDTTTMTPIVSPPVAGQPWRICGFATSSNGPPPAGELMCSLDGGKTWHSRPQLQITFVNPDKGPFIQAATEFAVSPDGTMYAYMLPGPYGTDIPEMLYRLSPNADRWQSLGPAPGYDLATADIPGAGILWEAQFNIGPTFAGLFPAAAT
jgi:hypothetical protein